ncbi:MAG TPA: hypothetical protein DD376_04405 [Sutterella sp.]|nr:hypothetical protein [Sutterella sp.]
MSQHNIGISLFEVQPSALDIFSKTESPEACDLPPKKMIKAIVHRGKNRYVSRNTNLLQRSLTAIGQVRLPKALEASRPL